MLTGFSNTLMIAFIFSKKRLFTDCFKLCGFLSLTLASMNYLSLNERACADPILDKAAQLLKEGRSDSALAVYSEYLKAHPTNLSAELALANVAIRRFEHQKAKGILKKTQAQHPDSAETAATLGRLYQLWQNSPTGKTEDNSRNYKALVDEYFRQALSLGSSNPLVLTYAGEWSLQQNDLITAERQFQKALNLNPTYIPAFQGMTRFYIKVRDLQRAKDTILHATELDSLDCINYFLTAQLLAMANRPAEAVKYALKSEQLDYGRLPERDYFLATQYEKLGDAPNAIQYYETLTVYTPRESQVWLKLGELYETVNQADKSLNAFRKAVALKPDILANLYIEARQNTRLEKASMALKQWHRLLRIQSNDPATQAEGVSALASLYYLQYFYHPDHPNPQVSEVLKLAEAVLQQAPNNLSLQLDCLKMRIALQGQMSDPVRHSLIRIAASQDGAAGGEAAFLLDDLAKTAEQLESIEGLSDIEYAQLADRLLLIQELQFSKVFYQRANQLQKDTGYQAGMKRAQAKQDLAKQKVDEGNAAFNEKNYTTAIIKYEEARKIYRQWDNVYLRLGDTYEVLKKWPEAQKAYENAISLTPGLLDSPGFTKNYNRIKKKATK